MGYDRFGRVTQDGDLAYAHDGNGNRTRVEYPGGMTAVFTHDYADRPETLTLERPADPDHTVVIGATYEPSGPLASLSLGNGLIETRAHDSRYYPDAITVDGGTTTVLDWDYTTDAEGNPTAIADLLKQRRHAPQPNLGRRDRPSRLLRRPPGRAIRPHCWRDHLPQHRPPRHARARHRRGRRGGLVGWVRAFRGRIMPGALTPLPRR